MLIPEIKSRKTLVWCGQKWLWPSWSQGEWMNEAIELIFHVDANKRKLRIIYFNNF